MARETMMIINYWLSGAWSNQVWKTLAYITKHAKQWKALEEKKEARRAASKKRSSHASVVMMMRRGGRGSPGMALTATLTDIHLNENLPDDYFNILVSESWKSNFLFLQIERNVDYALWVDTPCNHPSIEEFLMSVVKFFICTPSHA